jgi:hypothetical protein
VRAHTQTALTTHRSHILLLSLCFSHARTHAHTTGAGFFIGDGAGVGKGRQVSGIILDNFARGRRQHVWLSTSTDLVKDAERDLRDLGVHLKARCAVFTRALCVRPF